MRCDVNALLVFGKPLHLSASQFLGLYSVEWEIERMGVC